MAATPELCGVEARCGVLRMLGFAGPLCARCDGCQEVLVMRGDTLVGLVELMPAHRPLRITSAWRCACGRAVFVVHQRRECWGPALLAHSGAACTQFLALRSGAGAEHVQRVLDYLMTGEQLAMPSGVFEA